MPDETEHYSEEAAKMRDESRYNALRQLTFADRHPCPVPDCRLSAEEHHRLAYGYLSENLILRRRIDLLEHGGSDE